MRVGIIAAMTPDGIIGVDGGIPWHYKADLQRFKQMTMDSSIVFGLKTWISLPGRLAGRSIFVVSVSFSGGLKGEPPAPGGISRTIKDALDWAKVHTKTETAWIGGGGKTYRSALEQKLVDFIDLTIVPPIEVLPNTKVTHFPTDLLEDWEMVKESTNPEDPRLLQRIYHPKP